MRGSWVAVVLVGCGLSEEEFIEKNAELACTHYIECYPDVLPYDSVDECIAQSTAAMNDALGDPDCTYDEGSAADCLGELRQARCEDAPQIFEPCTVAFTCTNPL